MGKTKVANSFGRCYHRKKEKFDLKDLKPGDHIAEESQYGLRMTFWHHAIVESVDIDAGKINVIHYYHDLDPPLKWPSICRSSFDYSDSFYRIVYEENECYPASKVLKKARERLGEELYNPCSNNCEHFANECKTGERKCHQIWTGIEILGKNALSLAHVLACDAKKLCRLIFKKLYSLFRQPAVAEVAEEGFKFSTRLSILIAALIEIVLLYMDYSDAKKRYDEGKLTREEFVEVVVKRVCAAVCSIPACSLGFYLGAMVPIPILGFFTSFVGGTVGDFLGKWAGGKLGELLTPLFIEHLLHKGKSE